jgi:hypothetical protein
VLEHDPSGPTPYGLSSGLLWFLHRVPKVAVTGTAVLAELEHLFTAVRRFRFQLDHVGWLG